MLSASLVRYQAVADAGLGLQVLGTSGIALQLAAELGDINAEILSLFGVLGPPHFIQQLPLREHFSGVLNQDLKQLVFVGRQVDFLAVDPDDALFEIDLDGTETSERASAIRTGAGASQSGANAGKQLAYSEGLGDVVVGA
jgi:hypothetical protein